MMLPSGVALCHADVAKMSPGASSLTHAHVWDSEPKNGQSRRISYHFWPSGIHMLSSQQQQFLQHDGGLYGEIRLFQRAGEPHQNGPWPSPAAVSHGHNYIPPSTGATLGISAGCCISQGRATRRDHSLNRERREREERRGVTRLRLRS